LSEFAAKGAGFLVVASFFGAFEQNGVSSACTLEIVSDVLVHGR
jgi:hypothetical protein